MFSKRVVFSKKEKEIEKLFFGGPISGIAVSSVHTSNIYLATKVIATKFSRNLKNISKKIFQWFLLKMTTFCLHTPLQIFELVSIDSRIMARGISLATFTITVFSESRFWCLRAPAHSFSTDYNLWSNGLRSGLEEGQTSATMKSGMYSCNCFCIFFSLCKWSQISAESTAHLHTQIQFPLEVVRHCLTWLHRPRQLFLCRLCKNESGLQCSMKHPVKPLAAGGDDPSEPLGFCLWSHNNF